MLKGKQKGRQFEMKVRKFLQQKGWFVYTKGVSTPGPDILAIKNCTILLLELKTYKQMSYKNAEMISKRLYAHLAEDYAPKLKDAGIERVLFGGLVEVRSKRSLIYTGLVLLDDEKQFITKIIINTFSSLESWYECLTNWIVCFGGKDA